MANEWLKDVAAGVVEGIEQIRRVLDTMYDDLPGLSLKLNEVEDFVRTYTNGPVSSDLLSSVVNKYREYCLAVGNSLESADELVASYRAVCVNLNKDKLLEELTLWTGLVDKIKQRDADNT
jgi:hypothetical protein